MAENDANGVGTPPPLVCSAGGVRLHGQTSSRKGPDSCGWPQPVAGWSSAPRRCAPTHSPPRKRGRSAETRARAPLLVPSSNHTANTVSEALLRHVVPYFGTPRRLLSDRGQEFVGEIWGKLLRSLGVQRVLTSPYHSEGNAINECSHRTLNNMLRARLLEGSSSKAWVDKVPGIMLSLNAMSHEPHGFSALMVATGREPTLPPDVQQDAHASPAVDDPSDYVEVITQRL